MSGSESAGELEAVALAVRRVRERAGMSEAEVERRAELPDGLVSAIERAETSPTWGTLRRIVYALGIPLPSLMEEVEAVEAGASATRSQSSDED
jgi:transcriptional regulator with XRE-family HTH domain